MTSLHPSPCIRCVSLYSTLVLMMSFGSHRSAVDGWIIRNTSPLPPLLHELYVWRNEDRPSPSSPLPVMPSLLFQDLALSQMELLLYSLHPTTATTTCPATSKVKSIALYLPQENARTGQLEFLPALICPPQERVFIANEWQSGIPPALPKAVTRLPGFAHAATLLPRYPMLEANEPSLVEEVVCDWPSGATALSVPLLLGSHTVGVLLVSPQQLSSFAWTGQEKAQVARAAQSLSLALQMDTERQQVQQREQQQLDAWSDQVHQLKNPIQALRTYGKLLQRRMLELSRASDSAAAQSEQEELLALTDRLLQQSDRIVERLPPIDALATASPWALQPARRNDTTTALSGLTWTVRPQLLPANRTVDDNRRHGNLPQLWNGRPSSSSVYNDTHASPIRIPGDGHEDEKKKEVWPMSFVTDILEPIFETYRVLAEDRQISFIVHAAPEEDLPGVPVDPLLLQEILVNLLDNAFKYSSVVTDPSSTRRPQVRVQILPHDDTPGVRIRVEDNGPGIAESDRAQVFDRGFRSRHLSLLVSGTGLGLSVAQSYAHRLGGQLSVLDNEIGSLPGAVLELKLFR
jgi:signal transduction histidine kinase